MDHTQNPTDPIQQNYQSGPISNDNSATTDITMISVTDSKPQLVESKLINDYETDQSMVYATLEKVTHTDCPSKERSVEAVKEDFPRQEPPKCDDHSKQELAEKVPSISSPSDLTNLSCQNQDTAKSSQEATSNPDESKSMEIDDKKLEKDIPDAKEQEDDETAQDCKEDDKPHDSKVTDDDFSGIHEVPSELIEAALSKANNIMHPLMTSETLHKIDLKDVDDLITSNQSSESRVKRDVRINTEEIDLKPEQFLSNSQVEQLIADVENQSGFNSSNNLVNLDETRVTEREKKIEHIHREITDARDSEPQVQKQQIAEGDQEKNEEKSVQEQQAHQKDDSEARIEHFKDVEQLELREEEELGESKEQVSESDTPEIRQKRQQDDLKSGLEEEKLRVNDTKEEDLKKREHPDIERQKEDTDTDSICHQTSKTDEPSREESSLHDHNHVPAVPASEQEPIVATEQLPDTSKPAEAGVSEMEVDESEPTSSTQSARSFKQQPAEIEKNIDSGVEDEPKEDGNQSIDEKEEKDDVESNNITSPKNLPSDLAEEVDQVEKEQEIVPEEGAPVLDKEDSKIEESKPIEAEPKVVERSTRRQSRRRLSKQRADDTKEQEVSNSEAFILNDPSTANTTATKSEECAAQDEAAEVEPGVTSPGSKRGRARRCVVRVKENVDSETSGEKESKDDSDDENKQEQKEPEEEEPPSSRRSTRTLRTRLPKRPAEEESPKPVKQTTIPTSNKPNPDIDEPEPELASVSAASTPKVTSSSNQRKKIKLSTPATVREARRKTENLESTRTPVQESSSRARNKTIASTTSKISEKNRFVITQPYGCIFCGYQINNLTCIFEHKKRCRYFRDGEQKMIQMARESNPKGNKKRLNS